MKYTTNILGSIVFSIHKYKWLHTKYKDILQRSKEGLVAAPTRFSIRRKIRSAITNAAKNRKPCLRISRTVEQINQSKDEWREKTSKLMYIVALGLIPTEGWEGLPKPVIEVSQANAAFIEKIQERFQLKRLKKLETVRQKRQARFSRYQKYARSAGTGRVSTSMTTDSDYSSESSCPELIDLVSEGDDDTSSPRPQWSLSKTVEVVDLVLDEETEKRHTILSYRNISIIMAK